AEEEGAVRSPVVRVRVRTRRVASGRRRVVRTGRRRRSAVGRGLRNAVGRARVLPGRSALVVLATSRCRRHRPAARRGRSLRRRCGRTRRLGLLRATIWWASRALRLVTSLWATATTGPC
ncbi:hypothetical protein IWW46_002158, partial [Coemansia sp. RSA 2440]